MRAIIAAFNDGNKMQSADEEDAEVRDDYLKELKEELFNLRFQLAINQLENPHRITAVKRDIARIMTVLNEKN